MIEMLKILMSRIGGIGDVIMTTPLIKAIKEKYPDSKLYYMVGRWSSEALKKNPYIDEIIEVDDEIFFYHRIFALIKHILKMKKYKFDIGITLDKHYLLNLFMFLYGVKKRIGFTRGNWLDKMSNNNCSIFFDGTKHELDYYNDVAKYFGVSIEEDDMSVYDNIGDGEYAKQFISQRTIVIAPGGAENVGTKMEIKRWPIQNYISLGTNLLDMFDCSVVLIGGKNDIEIGEEIEEKEPRIANIIGKTTLQQSAAIMRWADLVITCDSGVLHLAATTSTPIIAFFGPTPVHRFVHRNCYAINKDVDCAPCYTEKGDYNKECKSCKAIDQITVLEVLDVIKRIIN